MTRAIALELAPHLVRAYLPRRLHSLARLYAMPTAATLAARWAYSVRSLNPQDLRATHGLERVGCLALLSGLSLLDALCAGASGEKQASSEQRSG